MKDGHHIFCIVAIDMRSGIGKSGRIPWLLKKEMAFFKKITTSTKNLQRQNMVIMGRKTWESLPKRFRPLPDRKNVILTSDRYYDADGATVSCSFEEALRGADDGVEDIFVIGGAQLYKRALQLRELDGIYLTQIEGDFACDTFFPQLPTTFKKCKKFETEEENGVEFSFYLYSK